MKREGTGVIIVLLGIVLVVGAVKGTWPKVWHALIGSGEGGASSSSGGTGPATGSAGPNAPPLSPVPPLDPTLPPALPTRSVYVVPAAGWPGSMVATEG